MDGKTFLYLLTSLFVAIGTLLLGITYPALRPIAWQVMIILLIDAGLTYIILGITDSLWRKYHGR